MSECVVRFKKRWVDEIKRIGCAGCPIKFQSCLLKEHDKEPCPILCVLPENHGRLIDAVALLNHIVHNYCDDCDDYNGLRCRACPHDDDVQCIEDAPTIVPATAERSET